MAVICVGSMALLIIGSVFLNILSPCETSIYPGLRRKPLQALQQPFDVSSDFLTQLMEENARRRLQQQIEQQLELIKMQMNRRRQKLELREKLRQQKLRELETADTDNEYAINNNNNNENNILNNNINNNNNAYELYDNSNPDFSFKVHPPFNFENLESLNERPFAMAPNDPRFFEDDTSSSNSDENELDARTLDEYEEYMPAENNKNVDKDTMAAAVALANANPNNDKSLNSVLAPAPVDPAKHSDSTSTANFHRIKPQTAAAAAVAGANLVSMKDLINAKTDLNSLFNKLQKDEHMDALSNHYELSHVHDDHHSVLRQPMDRTGGEHDLQLVALIASVSAAVTAGFIWLGLAWFRSRSKAAADVEYPAYGVTGPNKDISPSGDRKLAQSAQMYHYQHQKQQIIAMENRQAAEGSCGLSDVESDDDNEEGDYTVYECPGLAPTGEMEVKNPLFLDDTPATPSSNVTGAAAATTNNITQATAQQPAQVAKKIIGKAMPSSTANEEKPKKKNKK